VTWAGGPQRSESEAVSSKLFRCACMRRWIPLAYREELYQVLRLSGPLLLARILNFLLPFVCTIFCGHIGNAVLAGYALATATINVTTGATGYGLVIACDTLISQTYGSKNLKRIGVILQRSSLILLLFCLPCWALLINSENLLLLLHQEEAVASLILKLTFSLLLQAMFLHQLQVAYLQNQGIILPQMYTAAVANIINLGVNYVLIYTLHLGVTGSAIASSLSQITICLLLFLYIRWKKLHQLTWGGWSTDCLQEWGSYMHLAVPGAFMTCFEWWIWEIGSFLAGILGETDLAAWHIIMEIGTIIYMFPLGIHAAACVRVGNALGAGNTSRALLTCKVALVLAGALAVLQGVVVTGCKSFIVNFIFDGLFLLLSCVCSGILIGSGMQKIAAFASLISYYGIGLPVGIALMFFAHLRILGFWLGLLVCVALQMGFFLVIIIKLNWTKVTQKAQQRAGRTVVMVLPKRPIIPKTVGYSAVHTDDQELKANHEKDGNKSAAGGADESKNTKPQMLLSVSQLILRRGFILIVLVLILIIGVVFHIVFPAPEPSVQSRANFTLNWANDSTATPLTPMDLNKSL
uniref:Multidrug and toxin extrusion protein n=1 Tax=Labrus bergylta TaxID=56723 RepID=A0A3Q3FH70_9LABR